MLMSSSSGLPPQLEAEFRRKPLAFYEELAEERARLEQWKKEDPISLQDALNTSGALVDSVREGDLEELRRVVADAALGELLQGFVLQAVAVAVRDASLDMVRELVAWGAPLNHESLSQAIHLVCEVTNRENFSSTWRIIQILVDGNENGKIDINCSRPVDGWSPLCIACAGACLPLAFKLLELDADPNVITRASETPMQIARTPQPDDTAEQLEARGIITNMIRSYGGADSWREALSRAKQPRRQKPAAEPEDVTVHEDGSKVVIQATSKTHTRFSA